MRFKLPSLFLGLYGSVMASQQCQAAGLCTHRPKTSLPVHRNCVNTVYPSSDVMRFHVPENLVSWDVEFPDYCPPRYDSPVLHGKPWADDDVTKENSSTFKWNALDGPVNRVSFEGEYELDADGRPMNPRGRTGIKGRGLLGRWGPNHAADPVVTRWKRNPDSKEIVRDAVSGKRVLEFVAIKRRDNGMWAIPGGMVDPDEKVSKALMREFMEEAMGSDDLTEVDKNDLATMVENFFSSKRSKVYEGYVDDPRNTDNAWMETEVWQFHDDSGDAVGRLKFQAGSDASQVRWVGISRKLELYASHADFVAQVAKMSNAHF